MSFSILILFFFILIQKVNSDTWVILLAGIYNFDQLGYAAEADVYQTYYQLTKGGINPNNIIVFAMNNSAYNSKNKYPGVVYNYPGGPNTYPTIEGHMDYVFRENNPENFLKVLRGEDMTGIGSGRTLESTEDDFVFIASSQHGGPGFLEFVYLDVVEDFSAMYASDIIETIRTMKEKKMFKSLVWYMTACYSGSIWNKEFSEDDNVFIVTGAPIDREAVSCDWNYEMGIPINSCLQKHWQEFNRQNGGEKSIYEQYLSMYSEKETQISYVEEYCAYGNSNATKYIPTKYFQGDYKVEDDIGMETINILTIPKKVRFRDFRYGKPKNLESLEIEETFKDPIVKGFDSDYIFCDAYPKVDENCRKDVISFMFDNYGVKCLEEKRLNGNYFLDWIRDCCASGVDSAVLQQSIKTACANVTKAI